MSQLNRRTFIKNSALAAAVAGLSAQTYAQSAGANGDLRVAVVGFRSRGLEHIKELKKIKGVRIVALCDVDSRVVAKGLASGPWFRMPGYEIDDNGVRATLGADATAMPHPPFRLPGPHVSWLGPG